METPTNETADAAVRLSRMDPESRYFKAVALLDPGDIKLAVNEMEQAVGLRPNDYFFWMELGRFKDEDGDVNGAIAAFSKSIELAPYYAQPHWQLGNILLRQGQLSAAFAEIRKAVNSDSTLFPSMAELAWGAFDGDTDGVVEAVAPRTSAEKIALARMFTGHDKFRPSISLFRSCGDDVSAEDQNNLIHDLISAGAFMEAQEVWAAKQRLNVGDSLSAVNGILKNYLVTEDEGFDWRHESKSVDVHFGVVRTQGNSAAVGLEIDFSGDPHPGKPYLSRLVVVKPSTLYRLSFEARTSDLATGGPPVVVVKQRGGSNDEIARSGPLPTGTTDSMKSIMEFKTSASTHAIDIAVARQKCSSLPCPIFGKLWLKTFELEELIPARIPRRDK